MEQQASFRQHLRSIKTLCPYKRVQSVVDRQFVGVYIFLPIFWNFYHLHNLNPHEEVSTSMWICIDPISIDPEVVMATSTIGIDWALI